MSEVKRKRSSPKDGESRDKEPREGERGRGAPRKAPGDVGRVLRSVYDSTLNEDIPDDFLDLLGKLD